MNTVTQNVVDLIENYEGLHIATIFKEFGVFFCMPVASLEEALKEIKLDFAHYSKFSPHPELTKLNTPDAPEGRYFGDLEAIKRALYVRLKVTSLVNKGEINRAYNTLEHSASVVATMAYDLCRRRERERARALEREEIAELTKAFAQLSL